MAAADDQNDFDFEAEKSGSPRKSSVFPDKAFDAVVTFMDGREVSISCPQGKHTTGEELRELVARDIKLSPEYSNIFSVWIVSGSLQLQMKPHHMPFKVMKKWPELLQTYSYSDPYGEVPVLYFKRDAAVHQGIERQLHDPIVIKLLFDEMSFNVLYSLYPCEVDDAAYLAGIHLQLARGARAKKDDIPDIENCLIPEHLKKSIKEKAWIKRVLEERAKLALSQDDVTPLHLLYLQHGWEWPIYGATFFFGEIEPPQVKHVFRERPDEVVRVGVNLDGVHIINDKKNKFKLSLDYSKLTYNSYEDPESGECCFMVEHAEEGQEALVQTIVWTPQATMIDTLVTRFIEDMDSWQDFLQKRRVARGQSVHAGGFKAKGRAGAGEKKGALNRFNTIFKKATGGDGAAASGMFTLARFRTRKPQRNIPTTSDFDQADAPVAISSRQEVVEHPL